MKVIAITLGVIGCLVLALAKTRQPVPVRFQTRAAIGVATVHSSVFAKARYYDDLSDAFKGSHARVADQALIIRKPELMDSAAYAPGGSGAWGLVSLLSKIPGGPQATTASVEEWFRDWVYWDHHHEGLNHFGLYWTKEDSSHSLSKIPLRTLAVVNRLDLARMDHNCEPDRVCGAEIRFVYAGFGNGDAGPAKPYFTMILEFVLEAMPLEGADGFAAMGKRWSSLAGIEPGAFQTAFEGELTSTLKRVSSARIRINSGFGGTVWTFGEFDILAEGAMTRPGGRFETVDLKQQPGVDVTGCQQNELATFAKANADKILQSTHDFTGSGLPTKVQTMQRAFNVLTLGTAIQDRDVEDVRFALSITSCVGCHSLESQPLGFIKYMVDHPDTWHKNGQFDHVHYREPGEASKLSFFLTGGKTGEPTTELPEVTPPLLGNCASVPAKSRQYNDLVRRHMFLEKLATAPPISAEDWQKRFAKLGLVGSLVH